MRLSQLKVSCLALIILTTATSSAAQTPRPANSAPAASAATPVVKFFDVGAVVRSSARQNEQGLSLPPWTKVELSTFEFSMRPTVGASVTILSLDTGLAPLELKITKVARAMNECTAENFWRADLPSVTRHDFFDAAPLAGRSAESPFDVLLIYPAVKNARLLKASALNARTLPRGVAVKAVRGAVDLTGDDAPELLYVAYCCDAPAKPLSACDYQCSRTYQKVGAAWKLVKQHEPC